MSHSFCQYVVDRDAPLVVEDARLVPLLKDNKAIGDIGVVAYLGVPLALPDGEVVGALAAIDNQARVWTEDDMRRLRSIAKTVEKEMDVRISESRWRTLFEGLREGFIQGRVVRDGSGNIVDWRYEEVNSAWYDLIGLPRGSAVGRTIREVFPGIKDDWVDEFASVVETGEPVRFTRQVGSLSRWYDGVAQSIGADRFTVIFIEVTDRIDHERRQLALLALGDKLRDAQNTSDVTRVAAQAIAAGIEVERIGFGAIDERSETVDLTTDWSAENVLPLVGTFTFSAFGTFVENLKRGETVAIDDVESDLRTRENQAQFVPLQIRSLLNLPILEHGKLALVVFAHTSRPRPWSEQELGFVRQIGDRALAAIARIRAQETQAVLNGELSHRLKNSFAMVQAIANQTLKGVADRDAVSAFESRLQALSGANDVLMQQSWSSAHIKEVASAILQVFHAEDRITFSGPNIKIGPRATLSLSLLLHELATNASKYGGLSVPTGGIDIEWSIGSAENEPSFQMVWREHGGPAPQAPSSGGFGSRIIRMGLIGSGGVNLDYRREGLIATMHASLAQMQQA